MSEIEGAVSAAARATGPGSTTAMRPDDPAGHPVTTDVASATDWDDLPLDPPPAVTRPVRPPWLNVVAIVLVLNAASLIFYAFFFPDLTAIEPDPLPIIGVVTGAAALAAAFGVFRRSEWGRWLAIALVINWLARDAVLAADWLQTGFRGLDTASPNVLLDVVIPIAANGTMLGLLLLRWPRGERQAEP